MSRASLLSTTMLSGVVGGVFLVTVAAKAADLRPVYKAPPAYDLFAPAVDGVNAKFEALGGSLANKSIWGTGGSLSIPLGGQFGVQFDGMGGQFDHRGMGVVGAHFFWRDPRRGLLGLFFQHTHWEQFGGIHVNQIAAEAELYWGPVTLQGIAGVESGNSVTQTVGGFFQTYEVRTRFFDKINLAYYPLPDLKLFAGHRYLGGKHSAALGGEFALPMRGPIKATLFGEGRIGEGDSHGAWGGLKVYFGQKDKSLIRRHREDDPLFWVPDSLLSIQFSQSPVPLIVVPPPPACPPPRVIIDGVCVLP